MHDDVFGNFVYEPTDRLYREVLGQLHFSPYPTLDGAIDASLLFCKSGKGTARKKRREGFVSGDVMGKSARQSSCREPKIADPSSREARTKRL